MQPLWHRRLAVDADPHVNAPNLAVLTDAVSVDRSAVR